MEFLNVSFSRFITAVLAVVAAGSGISCTVSTAPERPLSLRWVPNPSQPGQASVKATGIDTNEIFERLVSGDLSIAERSLRVYARPVYESTINAGRSLPSMLGDYEAKDGILSFRPKFPLEPGMRYVAVLDPAEVGVKDRGILTATYV
ncbi:MAG TPA: hypothetical protein VFB66_03645, partial [Tepidisphaeraceae bacterium]|nr:hypothetical protein [Tepidisphaeraceae bacterium]